MCYRELCRDRLVTDICIPPYDLSIGYGLYDYLMYGFIWSKPKVKPTLWIVIPSTIYKTPWGPPPNSSMHNTNYVRIFITPTTFRLCFRHVHYIIY